MSPNFLQSIFDRPQDRVDLPTENQIKAAWEGTPYLDHLAYAQLSSQGHDKTFIMGMASETLDMAKAARERSDWQAAELALCLSIAYSIIANELRDAATSMTNLGLIYEYLEKYEVAIRVQLNALALKQY